MRRAGSACNVVTETAKCTSPCYAMGDRISMSRSVSADFVTSENG
jgi:hypothetical protein